MHMSIEDTKFIHLDKSINHGETISEFLFERNGSSNSNAEIETQTLRIQWTQKFPGREASWVLL